ncbi:uncharacterized protein [Nicotiana tomentosiformis]|uniref:uncharacterized protein n=1 Tax=Nicotiana tomentosiformis TaxID=4098 RepID=UPI00388C42BA
MAESEDAQDFIDNCQRILHTAGILETSGDSFTNFQLTGAAYRWWEAYEFSRPAGAIPLTWHKFSVLFLEKFVSQTHREELRRQFVQLCYEGMLVAQYEMRFLELASHVAWFVLTERERILRFIDGLNYGLHFIMTQEIAMGARFDEVVVITRCLDARPAQSSFSALPVQSSSCAPSVQGLSVPGFSSGYSCSRGPIQSLPPFSDRGCFECGELGNMRRYCPHLMGGPV